MCKIDCGLSTELRQYKGKEECQSFQVLDNGRDNKKALIQGVNSFIPKISLIQFNSLFHTINDIFRVYIKDTRKRKN